MNYSLRALVNAPLATFSGVGLALALAVRALVTATGAFFLILCIHALYFGDMSNWHEVKATVTGSSAHSENPVVYTPIFTYQVNGRTYSGEGTKASSQDYSAGSQLTIAVNPADPTDYYQRDPQGTSKLLLLLGAIAITSSMLLIGVRTVTQLVQLRQ